MGVENEKKKCQGIEKREWEPEGGALGRLKKPQLALEAREWRWVCDGSMKRANPSPYNTNPRLGLSAIAVTQMLEQTRDNKKRERDGRKDGESSCLGKRGALYLENILHVDRIRTRSRLLKIHTTT